MANFFIVSGPSAVGKSTIVNYILHDARFHLNVSFTTRSPRPGEKDGLHYNFVSKDVFKQKIDDGFFLEYTYFNDNYYGTPAHLDVRDKIVILDIDIIGYQFFKKHYPESYFCLITSDRNSIQKRLETRMIRNNNSINVEEVGSRMKSFDDFERIDKSNFNYIIDNSGELRDSLMKANIVKTQVIQHFK